MKKLLRTLQVYFPFLLDAKFSLMRLYRNTLKRPFENDFNALSLFPEVPGALFLDVGANRGQSTDAMLMMWKSASIQLFEPNNLLFEKLKDLYRGKHAIIVNDFGLGNEHTESTLYVPFYRKWMFDGLASFDPGMAMNWLRNRIFFYNDIHLTAHKSTCQIRRLDDLKLAPFLIKLDVQGFEYKALKGGEETIKLHEPVLLIEAPDSDVVAFLKGFDYDFYAYQHGKLVRGERGELNTFFMTATKSRLVERHIEQRRGVGLLP